MLGFAFDANKSARSTEQNGIERYCLNKYISWPYAAMREFKSIDQVEDESP